MFKFLFVSIDWQYTIYVFDTIIIYELISNYI